MCTLCCIVDEKYPEHPLYSIMEVSLNFTQVNNNKENIVYLIAVNTTYLNQNY